MEIDSILVILLLVCMILIYHNCCLIAYNETNATRNRTIAANDKLIAGNDKITAANDKIIAANDILTGANDKVPAENAKLAAAVREGGTPEGLACCYLHTPARAANHNPRPPSPHHLSSAAIEAFVSFWRATTSTYAKPLRTGN